MITSMVRMRGSLTKESLGLGQDLVNTWGIHPFMVQLARAICAKARVTEPYGEAMAIWAWVRANVAYRLDPVGSEWIQDPFETCVISRAGDCDDMSVACGALLQAIGHRCSVCAVWWQGESDYSHAICRDEKINLVVDPCSDIFQPWPKNGLQIHAIMGA